VDSPNSPDSPDSPVQVDTIKKNGNKITSINFAPVNNNKQNYVNVDTKIGTKVKTSMKKQRRLSNVYKTVDN